MKIKSFLILYILVLGLQSYILANNQSGSEYHVKGAMMVQFLSHVDWPEDSDVSDKSKPFVIAVIGENPFGSYLDKISKKVKIKSKNLKIRYISEVNEISGCHLLFISRSMKRKLQEIIEFTKDKPILPVGDTRGYAEMGVHINFYLEHGKVRFEINQLAVLASVLKVNYHLFQYAKIVKPPQQ